MIGVALCDQVQFRTPTAIENEARNKATALNTKEMVTKVVQACFQLRLAHFDHEHTSVISLFGVEKFLFLYVTVDVCIRCGLT